MEPNSTYLWNTEKEFYEIRLESIGGLGANLCGKMLGELGALYLNLNALSFSSYGSEKRGSPVKSHIRWCPSGKELRLNTPVVHPDLLGIFHEALLCNDTITKDSLHHTCVVLHTALTPKEVLQKYHLSCSQLFCIPAQDIAMREKSRVNMIMFGALTAAINQQYPNTISPELLEALCQNVIGAKYPQLTDANLRGLRAGFHHILSQTPYAAASADTISDRQTPNPSYTWGYDNAPLGGINPLIGSTVSNDLSASREGYIPLFRKEKCINCGLCDSTCPDMVFQFVPGIYREKRAMVNKGLDYTHCKGCLRCVEICPTNALVAALEKDYSKKPHNLVNRHLLTTQFETEKRGANPDITSESYLTENRISFSSPTSHPL